MGANINARDNYGRTPLQVACSCGKISFVRFLLEKGAEIELYNHCGGTALSLARMMGHASIAKLLEEYGARR